MKEFALFFGILVLWIALSRWVLPWFGIPTCMSGGCSLGRCPASAPDPENRGPENDETMNVAEPKGNQP